MDVECIINCLEDEHISGPNSILLPLWMLTVPQNKRKISFVGLVTGYETRGNNLESLAIYIIKQMKERRSGST